MNGKENGPSEKASFQLVLEILQQREQKTMRPINFSPVSSSHCLLRGESTSHTGATENAGLENARLENAAPDCRGGKRGSSTVWKAEVSVI